jgi:hypothetical protein
LRTAAAAAAALALVPLSGCGGGDKRTIPHDTGSTLIRLLKDARDQSGDPSKCRQLGLTVAALQARVGVLPPSVDRDTRDSLTNGVSNLADDARRECAHVQTTPTTTTPEPTTPTQAPPPPPTSQPSQTSSQPSQTTPPPSNTQPQPPSGNGGAPGPPGQEKKGGGKQGKTGKHGKHDKAKQRDVAGEADRESRE